MDYWLISLPGEKTPQQAFEKLNNVTSTLSTNWKFNTPELKVGTLDVLVGLSDELTKHDTFCESTTRRVVGVLSDVLEGGQAKLQESLKVNGLDLESYLTRFTWETGKYPPKQPLPSLTEIIVGQVAKIEADLKTRAKNYLDLKNSLNQMDRKETGSLMTKNLGGLVKKEHFVMDSEYLVTLLVVVPLAIGNDWWLRYERLAEFVVPRSSYLVTQDTDHMLVTVTLFRRCQDDFKHKCRENKFMVRDFIYDEKILQSSKEERARLADDKQRQYAPLVRWLTVNFSEAFIAWIHVKALRVFVESVLRYGLPVNFQAVLMRPNRKTSKKLRDTLTSTYRYLDHMGGAPVEMGGADVPGLMANQQTYHPYVFYEININMVDTTVKKTGVS